MVETAVADIAGRLRSVGERIAAATERSGREPGSVQLVVVTKGQPVERIRMVVDAGADLLGENYAEEAVEKIEALDRPGIRWAMIGHVQSRKAGLVAGRFDSLQSLDSVKLARRLDAARVDGAPMPVLIQVNVSGEEAKSGLPGWSDGHFENLARVVDEVRQFPHLDLQGLMTVPPFLPPAEVRPYFRKLAALRARLRDRFPGLRLGELSMGMSGDFEAAIEEGATLVRIGTAILGPRA